MQARPSVRIDPLQQQRSNAAESLVKPRWGPYALQLARWPQQEDYIRPIIAGADHEPERTMLLDDSKNLIEELETKGSLNQRPPLRLLQPP